MKMKSLIKAGLALSSSSILHNVYVGIEDGRINVLTNELPQDFEDAELIIGNWDRVICPSFVIIHSSIFFFPFRFRIFSGKLNPYDILSIATPNDAYYFAILAAYHLLKTGVTTVVFSDPFPESIARGIMAVGIRPVIAVGVGCPFSSEDWEKEFLSLYNRWSSTSQPSVILKLCDITRAKEVFEFSRNYNIPVLVDSIVDLSKVPRNLLSKNIIALGGCSRRDLDIIRQFNIKLSTNPSIEICNFTLGAERPSISLDLVPSYDVRNLLNIATSRLLLTPEEAFKSVTLWGYEQLGMKDFGEIKIGNVADLLVFSYNEPLSLPIDRDAPYETLVFSAYNLESVLVNGEAILDGGVPLNVGMKDIEKAMERVSEVDRKYKNLEKNRNIR